MSSINILNIRQADGLNDAIAELKYLFEKKINLDKYSDDKQNVTLSNNKIMRICLLAGLSSETKRNLQEIENIQLGSNRIFETLFTLHNLSPIFFSLLKLRYNTIDIDWENNRMNSKVVNAEIFRGYKLLMQEGVLEDWLSNTKNNTSQSNSGGIPVLNLNIGSYQDDIPATLNLNGKEIPNTQILVAGTTGSGKSNLLAVLLNEIRSLSVDSNYPVNFLLFDYKGEFSDPANNHWLALFETDRSAILDPISAPLPFNPFKSFIGKPQNEINLYSTELANALCAIDNARISANMSNRLSEAIISSYKVTKNKAISFDLILSPPTNSL